MPSLLVDLLFREVEFGSVLKIIGIAPPPKTGKIVIVIVVRILRFPMEGEQKQDYDNVGSDSDTDTLRDDDDDTMNLPDMEQDTLEINLDDTENNPHHHSNSQNQDDPTNEDGEEEEEQLDMKDLNEVMLDLMEHYDDEEDMNKLRGILAEAKHTRTLIQQSQQDPKQTIRGNPWANTSRKAPLCLLPRAVYRSLTFLLVGSMFYVLLLFSSPNPCSTHQRKRPTS